MAYARFQNQQSTGGYARLPLQAKPVATEPPKKPIVQRLGEALVPGSDTPFRDYGKAVAETAEKGVRKALSTGGRIFGNVVGGATGAALQTGVEAFKDKPIKEKVKAIGQEAVRSGRETGEFAANVVPMPVDIVKETAKSTVAVGQALTGNEDAMVNRMAEVLARNANMGEAVLGRPFSTVEEAKELLLSGDAKGWDILKDPAVISAIGGMGLDISVLSGAANKLVRSGGVKAGMPLEAPTGRFGETMSTTFEARTGIKTPPGIVRAEEMARTPLARATEPISKVMQKQAPPRFSLRPVEKLPPGPAAETPPTTPPPTGGRIPRQLPPKQQPAAAPAVRVPQNLPPSNVSRLNAAPVTVPPTPAAPTQAQQPTVDIRNLNKNLNKENTERVKNETLTGKRETMRADQPKIIERVKQTGLVPEEATPDTPVAIFRAGKADIQPGDHITLDQRNAERYVTQRNDSQLFQKQVPLKDLVKSDGIGTEFVYAPKNQAKVSDPLIEEARKYGSAEEFVNKQPVYYRGGEPGNFISPNKDFASEYGAVTEYHLPPKANLLNIMSQEADVVAQKYGFENAEQAEDIWFNPDDKLSKILKEEGYDGFVNDENIFVTDREILKTKSQLMDVYNQSTQRPRETSVTLRSQIAPTFKQLDSMWQKVAGDRIWSGLVKATKKGAQKLGSGSGAGAQFFRRMIAPKQFQSDDYIKLKDQLDTETQQAIDRALSFGDELSKLSDDQQLEIVDRIVSGRYDETPMGKLAEKVEGAFMELGAELVKQGKLSEEAFLKNYGRYFPRLYEKFERDGMQKIMGKLRGLKADLSYIKRRKDLPPEIREALGEIKKAPYPVAKRLLQEGVDIAKLKFFERTLESNLASSHAKQGWVKLPDNKRLGALSGKYVPSEIQYDITELAKAEMRPKWLEIVDNANQIWKGTKTILDPGVVTTNMVSNIILSDFAGLPPQRLDVWAGAFFDVLKQKGAYLGMKDQGKFRNTFVNKELQGLLPEIEKFQKLKPSDVKSMTDVASLAAHAVKKGWIKAGDLYNFLEEWSKTAVYKYHTESKGWKPKEAADHAEKWLFNYGDVPPIINWMRKIPFGPPFITFAYKSIPRFVESGIRMPFTWLKYIIALNIAGGGAMMLKKLGMTEEEFEKIKPKSAGNWLIYTGRAKDGTHDFIDLSRYFPFGRQVNPRKPFSLSTIGKGIGSSFVPASGGWGVAKALHVFGALMFGSTYRDSYFDKIIFDNSEKMNNDKRLFKALDYLWSDWTPSWIPSLSGDNPKAADYLRKALSDEQTMSKGVPQKYTLGEALIRFFGTKNVEMHPTLLREYGSSDIEQKMSKVRASLKRSTSPEEKKKLNDEMRELQKEKAEFYKSVGKLQKVR